MALDWIRSWLESSPYAVALGIRVESLEPERLLLSLPFREENSNGDKALHGGVAASMIDFGVQAVGRSALGEASGPWHTSSLQVAYLAAALGETIKAEAVLLRRGRDLAHVEVAVRSEKGRPIAKGLATLRGRFGAEAPVPRVAVGDDGVSDPGPLGRFVERIPFHAARGFGVELMAGARSRIVLPWREANADARGGVHEGAVLALLDTSGAMASWAEVGPGRFKASTVSLQARLLAPPDASDLVAFGRVQHHDRELLLAEVEVARSSDRALVAQGTVNYRIVTPELERDRGQRGSRQSATCRKARVSGLS